MKWRQMMLLLFLPMTCVGSCLLSGLVEEVAPSLSSAKAEVKHEDPLLDMQFSVANRDKNLLAFGFSTEEVSKIKAHIIQLSSILEVEKDPGNNLIRRRLAAVDDQDSLEVSFCRSDRVPVRYAAMRYLVVKNGASLNLFDFASGAEVAAQDWYTAAEIEEVHRKADLGASRYPDAARMAFAAILGGKDTMLALNEGRPPFGSNLLGGSWSWDDVRKKYGVGVIDRTMNYAALLLLVEEVAVGDGGICD